LRHEFAGIETKNQILALNRDYTCAEMLVSFYTFT